MQVTVTLTTPGDRSLPTHPDGFKKLTTEGSVHSILIDGAKCETPANLFLEFSQKLAFPSYFGHNWDALTECFFDFFALENGGLGSEYADRSGIQADVVILTIQNAERLLAHGDEIAETLSRIFHYTARANEDRRAADLQIILQPSSNATSYLAAQLKKTLHIDSERDDL